MASSGGGARRRKLGILHSNRLFDKHSIPMNAFSERTRRLLHRQIEQTETRNHVCDRCGVRFSSEAEPEQLLFACPSPRHAGLWLPHRISTIELRTYLDEVDDDDDGAKCFAYTFLDEQDCVPQWLRQQSFFQMTTTEDRAIEPFSHLDYHAIVSRSHQFGSDGKNNVVCVDRKRPSPVKEVLTNYYDDDNGGGDDMSEDLKPILVFPLFRSDSACSRTRAR